MPSSKIKATTSASAHAAHPHAHHGAAHDYSRNPMNIYWEMTQACGLACRHCRAEAISTPHLEELNTSRAWAYCARLRPSAILCRTSC